MSRRTAALAVGFAVLAVVWAAAAYALWRSSVPALELRHLAPRAFFTASQLHDAASYSRVRRLLWVLGTAAELGALWVYARHGSRWMRESAAGPAGTGMLLGMLGFALVWAVQVPFDVVGLWWERRHHLSSLGYATAVFGNWLALGGTFLFLCFALGVVMGLARLVGDNWWLPATPVFIGLALLFSFVNPYLTSTSRLGDPELRAAAARLEHIEGVRHVPIDVEQVHDVTTLPNAEATGLGPSRRVILWDTLLDGRFPDREVRVVIAHELGHLAHDHIWKAVGWYALFAFPGTFLIARATRRRGGMRAPDAVPLSLLALVALSLVAQPLENVVSRRLEAEADWSALRATHDIEGSRSLFRRFVATTLGEPDPPTWDYVLLESHPTIMQRLAMVEAYAASEAQSP